MVMPERKFQIGTTSYRYSINSQEKETGLNENITTALYWEYDSRIGRRWNIDPIVKPWESPFACFSNNPLIFTDELGNTSNPVGHTVKRGDNLTKLAKKYHTTVKDLAALNGIKNINDIKIGQVLKVRPEPVSPENLFAFMDASRRLNGKITPDEYSSIENSSLPFRDHGESELYEIRGNNVTFMGEVNKKTTSLYFEFKNAHGPSNSVFLDNHPLTQKVRKDVDEVNRLRFLAYQKYDGNFKPGDSYTNFAAYGGTFLPWKDNAAMAPQFIGTFSGDVFVSRDGKSLVFVVSDSKSATSLFLRLASDHDRVYYWNSDNTQNYYANTYQKYVWTEPINTGWYKKEKLVRGSDGKIK